MRIISGTSITIHCEWGSYALQYAINNSIPYFYLSLTGASLPTGTLYKGDSFSLYGYVRSSEAITNITGTIYASDGAVLQEVSITPEVTDYSLNGYYDANLRFGELPLGNYCYKMVASAGSETEVLASSSFSIVQPPLRLGLYNAVVPNGLTNVGDGIHLSGSIISNYAITNVTIGVYTLDGREIYAYRAIPGTTSFSLANAASSLPVENLPLGEYLFRITASSNGITKNLNETVFQPGNYSVDVDEELTQAVIRFINQSDSGTFFTIGFINNALGKMGFQEILIMAINSRNSWLWGTVGRIFEENHQNPYLIELYEKEVLDLICDMNPDTILIENPEAEFISWTQSLVKGFSIGLTDIQDKLGGMFEEDIKQLNKTLGKFNKALGNIEMTVEFANSLAKVMQNYENGLLILNQIAETVDAESNPELATAIDRVRAKFKTQTFNALINTIELETKRIPKVGVEEIAKALASCASKFDATMNGGVLYSLYNLAIDTTMKLTGGDKIATDYQTFMIQVNNYTTGIDAYSSSRTAIRAGDTSNEAINRFVCAFAYAKQAALRPHNTVLELEATTSSERDSIREYIAKLESVSFS